MKDKILIAFYVCFTLLVIGGSMSCEVYKWHRFKELMPKATIIDFIFFGYR